MIVCYSKLSDNSKLTREKHEADKQDIFRTAKVLSRGFLRQLFIHTGTCDKRQPQLNGSRRHCVLCTFNCLSRFMRNPTGQWKQLLQLRLKLPGGFVIHVSFPRGDYSLHESQMDIYHRFLTASRDVMPRCFRDQHVLRIVR